MFGWLRRQRRRMRQRRCRGSGWAGRGWRGAGRGMGRWMSGYSWTPQNVQQIPPESQKLVDEIYKLLPKADCGKCGFGSCYETAVAIAEGRAPPDACKIVGKKIKDKVEKIIGG